MKKLKQYLYLLVAVFALSSCSQQAPAIANEWKPSVIPASLNSDNTIRLVGGITQELAIALQADEEVTSRSDIHDIKLEFDLPQNVSIVGNGGSYQFSLPTKHAQHGRKLVTFDVQVKNSAILGAPGSRLA